MVYFDAIHAITVHDEIVNVSGGLLGIMKEGQIEAILDFIQSDDYYPTFEDKLCYLFFSIKSLFSSLNFFSNSSNLKKYS